VDRRNIDVTTKLMIILVCAAKKLQAYGRVQQGPGSDLGMFNIPFCRTNSVVPTFRKAV